MTFAIHGFGCATPDTVVDQGDALRIAQSLCCETDEQVSWLPTMYHGTGIEQRNMILARRLIDDVIHGTRHSNSVFLPSREPGDAGPTTNERLQTYREAAFPLALSACERAIDIAQIDPLQIDHLVTVSCTGFYAPGIDIGLIGALPLRPTVQRTHIGFMGCHGALNGLRVARALAASEPEALVLLCAVELCSIHYHYGWDPGKMIANAIFADGAAAVVGSAQLTDHTDLWRLQRSGSYLFPDTTAAMTWQIGDHGFEMTLSKEVPNLIRAALRPWLEGWLRQSNLSVDDIRSWAIHPGGPRILEAVEGALGLTRQQTAAAHDVFKNHGNMSSPTILFILQRLAAEQAPRPCVAIGFGPGLIAEVALFV